MRLYVDSDSLHQYGNFNLISNISFISELEPWSTNCFLSFIADNYFPFISYLNCEKKNVSAGRNQQSWKRRVDINTAHYFLLLITFSYLSIHYIYIDNCPYQNIEKCPDHLENKEYDTIGTNNTFNFTNVVGGEHIREDWMIFQFQIPGVYMQFTGRF